VVGFDFLGRKNSSSQDQESISEFVIEECFALDIERPGKSESPVTEIRKSCKVISEIQKPGAPFKILKRLGVIFQ
jgi:hypothetical protein